MMYSELNSVADEVKQIEGKVVEISQLVDVFSEKILQQVIKYHIITTKSCNKFLVGDHRYCC